MQYEIDYDTLKEIYELYYVEGRVLTVAILINGRLLVARSATNKGFDAKKGRVRYHVDDGSDVWHDPDDGAVALAKKLLDTIKEET